MSAREWKPGDVGMWHYCSEVTGRLVGSAQVALRVPQCVDGRHVSGPHWHLSGGGWTQYDRDVRPLVVIDPEDREQVERLRVEYHRLRNTEKGTADDHMQAALREFADPKPPRPEEPTGLGAVIEDADGDLWVRSHIDVPNEPWTRPHLSGTYAYAVIDVVRVLSPGYDPEATS